MRPARFSSIKRINEGCVTAFSSSWWMKFLDESSSCEIFVGGAFLQPSNGKIPTTLDQTFQNVMFVFWPNFYGKFIPRNWSIEQIREGETGFCFWLLGKIQISTKGRRVWLTPFVLDEDWSFSPRPSTRRRRISWESRHFYLNTKTVYRVNFQKV